MMMKFEIEVNLKYHGVFNLTELLKIIFRLKKAGNFKIPQIQFLGLGYLVNSDGEVDDD